MQHEVGSIVEGKVTGITKFGAFIELEDKCVGMVHISEISQSYVNDISDFLQEGQTVKVKILNIGDDGKISLSIKRTLPPVSNQNTNQKRNGNRSFKDNNHNNYKSHQNSNNFNNKNRSASSKESSFEDMLSKFIKSSDEKMSDLKQPERRRSYQRKDNRDYY